MAKTAQFMKINASGLNWSCEAPFTNSATINHANAYPVGIRTKDVDDKIGELHRRSILAGPNCWGTMAFLLGITPTLRYISDLEFNALISQAKTVSHVDGENLQDGIVLCIWSNDSQTIHHHHVALVVDGSRGRLYEKPGPDQNDICAYTSLTDVLWQAEKTAVTKLNLVDNFDQSGPGKYATLLDFSGVAALNGSDLEEKLTTYHEAGQLLNEVALLSVLAAYQAEIPVISNARELSLAEGIYYLLKSMGNEMHQLQSDFLVTKDKALARMLMRHATLRSLVDNATHSIVDQIHVYRRSLIAAVNDFSSKLIEQNGQLAIC